MGALKYYDTTTSAWKYVDVSDNATTALLLAQPLTGTVNGVNKVFTTANPFATISPYKNGLKMAQGPTADYTITGTNQITFATAPATGTVLTADYATRSGMPVAGTNSFVVKETPTGVIDGTNATFTTSRAYLGGSLQANVNGLAQDNYITETNPATGTFTLDVAPSVGDNLKVSYQYGSSNSGNADTVDNYHANATPTANNIPVLNSSAKMNISTIDFQSLPKSSAYMSSGPTAPGVNTFYIIPINTENYDVGNCFDPTTYRWTAPYDCIVTVSAGFGLSTAGMAATENMTGAVYKNGVLYRSTGNRNGSGDTNNIPVIALAFDMKLAAGDYISCYWRTTATSRSLLGGNGATWLDVKVIHVGA